MDRLQPSTLHGVAFGWTGGRSAAQTSAEIDCVDDAELHLRLENLTDYPQIGGDVIWQLTEQGQRYRTQYELLQGQDCRQWLRVDCEGKGVFAYSKDGIDVHWGAAGTGPEHYLQTVGLAVWLEQRQRPCIHANALATEAGVIGLVAPSRAGKTTLSMQLVAQGAQLLTDDMLVLHPNDSGEWWVYPGTKSLRLWPDSAEHFVGKAHENLVRVHRRFDKRSLPLEQDSSGVRRPGALKCLYLLERRHEQGGVGYADIRIDAVPPAPALMALMQNSMLADAYRALGVEEARMQQLAQLLEQIPLRRVSYPSGFENLPQVALALRKDVASRN